MGLRSIIASVGETLNAQEGYEGVVVVYGRREVTKQINQSAARAGRVVFFPADAPGEVAGPQGPGQPIGPEVDPTLRALGRALYTWREVILVHCWAWDPTAPTDELAQDDAARLLAAATMAALYQVKADEKERRVSVLPVAPVFVTSPVELKFGAAVVFELTVPNRVAAVRDPAVIATARTTPKTVFPDSEAAEPPFDVPLPP